MKIIILCLLFLLNLSLHAENKTEYDYFDCGIYEVVGELIESNGMNSKVKVHSGTKKEYLLFLKGPSKIPTKKIKEYYLYQFEVLKPSSGKNLNAKLKAYPTSAPFERLEKDTVKLMTKKNCPEK